MFGSKIFLSYFIDLEKNERKFICTKLSSQRISLWTNQKQLPTIYFLFYNFKDPFFSKFYIYLYFVCRLIWLYLWKFPYFHLFLSILFSKIIYIFFYSFVDNLFSWLSKLSCEMNSHYYFHLYFIHFTSQFIYEILWKSISTALNL